MFKTQYRITPYLLKLFEQIAIVGALVRNSRLQVSVKAPLERDAFARSVHSSTWIEGNLLSLAQVRAVVAGKDLLVEEKQKTEVANCVGAMRQILKTKRKPVTELGLLAVHARMIKGLLSKDRTGQYRGVQNYIVDARNKVIFTPPPPAQDRPRYYDMIQQTRDMDGDFTHWVEYVAQGLAWAHEDVQKRIKAGTLSLQGVSLTPKQEELLGLLEKKGVLGASEIGHTMKINRARVNQLISPLVRLGVVTREGAARAVRYRLNEK